MFLLQKSDSDWEKFGATDPYFGVLSQDTYRTENLTNDVRNAFFKTGQVHVDHVLHFIRLHIDHEFAPRRILDFGCGVGRLVIPFAGVAESVVGLDVSESMLREAQNNCRELPNIHFLPSDDYLSLLQGKFDHIHSFIVFQHISSKRGEYIFTRLLDYLDNNGVCMVHFAYANIFSLTEKLVSWIRFHFPPTDYFLSLLRGRNFFAPQMQMNCYNLNTLLLIIQKYGAGPVYVEYTDENTDCKVFGVNLYFRKNKI